VLLYTSIPFVIGLAGTVGQLAGVIHRSLTGSQMVAVNGFFLLLVALVAQGLGRTVTITNDAIEVTGWLTNRIMKRDHIKARRIAYGGKQAVIAHHVLIPRDPRERELALPPFLRTDRIFNEWLNTIPRVNV